MSRQSAGGVETEAFEDVCHWMADMKRRRENKEEVMWLEEKKEDGNKLQYGNMTHPGWFNKEGKLITKCP